LAAWLLRLTQEFLSQKLGTRRASVTVAAGTLQKAGMIQYSRGSVGILDRAKLEAAARDCYRLIERRKLKWQEEAS
jgi:Mn-dependent DtxR family transcriptional regulator